ncbi:DUF58 domain-containing protein [Chitinimonas sp.]|uniref:DUF58 domain-containing protein n=1 Tax=Chitinimonas sp. TaxID=1934313 RepID=UPI002F941C87
MIPSRHLILLVAAWALMGVAASNLPALLLAWWLLGGTLLLVALLDAARAARRPALRLERQLAGVWPVGCWGEVVLTLHLDAGRPLKLALFDDYPTSWELEGLPWQTRLAAGHFVRQHYRLKPNERGDYHFGQAQLRLASPLQLWQRTLRLGEPQQIRVFPDFSKLLGHTLTATDRRTPQLGLLRKRRRGEGTEFRQLREYRQGDSLRAIDWKASARQLKPISREYQEERDQQVVFLLDGGRRMLARDDGTSHYDHALNALLSLAWVAQKQGDAVGVLTFAGENRWLAPQKGRTGLDRLLSGLYDLQPSETAPDYVLAAEALLQRLRKRAFVVLVTNLRDEDSTAMREAYKLLSGKHMVLCASLREAALDAVQAAPVGRFADALRLAGTERYLAERRNSLRQLGLKPGCLIDVTPNQLAPALVDRYLEIKESGQL